MRYSSSPKKPSPSPLIPQHHKNDEVSVNLTPNRENQVALQIVIMLTSLQTTWLRMSPCGTRNCKFPFGSSRIAHSGPHHGSVSPPPSPHHLSANLTPNRCRRRSSRRGLRPRFSFWEHPRGIVPKSNIGGHDVIWCTRFEQNI